MTVYNSAKGGAQLAPCAGERGFLRAGAGGSGVGFVEGLRSWFLVGRGFLEQVGEFSRKDNRKHFIDAQLGFKLHAEKFAVLVLGKLQEIHDSGRPP